MRFATRIGLLIVILASCMAGLNAWLLGNRLADHLLQEQDRLVRTLTRGIGEATAREVLSRNVLAAQETLQNIVEISPELEYAYILDFDGQPFAHSFDHGFPSALLGLSHNYQGELGRSQFRSEGQLISDIAYPLVVGLDAELHLGFRQAVIQQVVERAQRDLLITAVSVAVVGILIALWYGRRLSQPLSSLRDQLQAYGAGTLDQPQPIDTSDSDIQALLQSFGEMVHERRELDTQLHDSQAYNRMLFETSPVGLALATMDGRLVDINAAFARTIGRSIGETLELSYWQITPEEYAGQEREQLASLRDHGRYGPYEKEYLHKDGHRVPVRLNGLLIERGEETFIWSAVEDISAETAANERQRTLATILEASPDLVGTASLDGEIRYVNPGGLQLLGWDEDLIGHSIADVHPQWALRVLREQAFPAAQRDGVWRGECALLDAAGQEIPVAMVIIAHRDVSGRPTQFSAIMSDIRELKAKEQQLLAHRRDLEKLVAARTQEVHQQARIIDQTHDAVITTDLQGTITSWNHGAESLFGMSREQAMGRPLASLYPGGADEFVKREVLAPLLETGELEAEHDLAHADGCVFHGHLSITLLQDEYLRPSGVAVYVLDISERKRIENELVSLAAELKLANQELEAFSYSVSHDLRTPLRAIDGFSQALVEDYGERLDATALDYLNRVRSAAQQMGRLIDDLLQLSRVTRATFDPQPVDLSTIAAETLQQLRASEPQRDARVDIEPGLRVMGDPGLLRILMDNLLGNAWKYTAKRELAHIRVARRRDLEGSPFVVQDNGAGFNMAYRDKLFRAFQRLHAADEFPGTGVGLATVSRIIARHRGRIWAEAEIDQGATFYFTLPDDRDVAMQDAAEDARE